MKVAALFLALVASVSAFAPATRMARSQTVMMAKKGSSLKYVDAIKTSELPKPGKATSVVVGGLDVCIAVATDGLVYAVGNKAPGTGSALFGGKVSKNTIKDEIYGTEFSLTTGDFLHPLTSNQPKSLALRTAPSLTTAPFSVGEPVGKWMPGGLGFLIGNFIKPESIPVYKIKKGGNTVQVRVYSLGEISPPEAS